MLSQTQARTVRSLLEHPLAPVFSLYLDLNPARVENAGKAYGLRCKGMLKETGVPDAVSERAIKHSQTDLPQAKTSKSGR